MHFMPFDAASENIEMADWIQFFTNAHMMSEGDVAKRIQNSVVKEAFKRVTYTCSYLLTGKEYIELN